MGSLALDRAKAAPAITPSSAWTLCVLTISGICRGRHPRIATWSPHPAAQPRPTTQRRSVLVKGSGFPHGFGPGDESVSFSVSVFVGCKVHKTGDGGESIHFSKFLASGPSLLARRSIAWRFRPLFRPICFEEASQRASGEPQFHNVGPSNISRGGYKMYAITDGCRYCHPRTKLPTSSRHRLDPQRQEQRPRAGPSGGGTLTRHRVLGAGRGVLELLLLPQVRRAEGGKCAATCRNRESVWEQILVWGWWTTLTKTP